MNAKTDNFDEDTFEIIASDWRGIYMSQRIQEIAKENGWKETVSDPESETYFDDMDEAIDWLNDNVAEEGHSFGIIPIGGGVAYTTERNWERFIELKRNQTSYEEDSWC